jgi:flagellar basal-body rod protein FlgF
MAGGAYVALSGMRTRMEQLDRLAADLANVSTAGYKSERVTTAAVERPDFQALLQTAVDVAAAPGFLDFRNGSMATTNRDLDMALEGRGFFAIDTPGGVRYTRAGQFIRASDGTLTTADGFAVQGDDGKPIKLVDERQVAVEPDGTVRTGESVAGRLKIVDFDDYAVLGREEGARFRVETGATAKTAAETTRVRGGALEQSNVSVVERMVSLTEVSRAFEALQRGITVLMNDVDGRAISELGKR